VLVALLIVPVAVRRRFLRLWQWLLALPTDKAPVVLVTMLTTQEVGSGVVWVKASDSVLYRHPGSACGVSAGSGWWSPIQDIPHVLVVLTFVIVWQLK